MSLIQKLMGRRQFLMAAGVASTCALTCKKLTGLQTRSLAAAEEAVAAGASDAGNRCPDLLSPLKIRNRVLKNRIMHCISPVYTLQGPENFPTNAWRNHYSNMAKNAAIITMEYTFGKYPKTYHTKEENFAFWSWEHISNNKWEDIPPVWNYIERAIEDVHCEGTLILFGGDSGAVGDMIVAGDVGSESGKDKMGGQTAEGGGPPNEGTGGGPPGMARASKSVEEIVKEAKELEETGFDVYQMDSPNREAAEAVRNATNLLIISSLGVGQRGMGGGIPGVKDVSKPSAAELQQAVDAAKELEGLADIILMKGRGSAGGSWETGKYEEGSSYYYAKAIKKAGVKVATCIGGGTHYPEKNNEYVASGVTDMVAMTRPLFADGDLVGKVAAGRMDDIIPCVQCQNCHAESMSKGPHFARCTVNPKWAAPSYKLNGIKAPLAKKKVAVIGGGPAGMQAAIVAAERGHKVTLYEKDAALGGLQKYTDYSPWVWPYKKFKDYQIHQVEKAGIDVKLNANATRDMIKSKGYDAVLVATGAEPIKSRMRGADAENVFDILTCYSNKKALGEKVVMIGSGKFGTEAALSMALDGHKVTVLASGEEMFDLIDIGPHNVTAQTNIYRNHPNFTYHMKAIPQSITGGKVVFTDEKGAQQSVQADSIVIWSGLKPRSDDAGKFAGVADEVILIGDCTGDNGRINRTIRNAFYIASRV